VSTAAAATTRRKRALRVAGAILLVGALVAAADGDLVDNPVMLRRRPGRRQRS
jgi:tellurite resistance protein